MIHVTDPCMLIILYYREVIQAHMNRSRRSTLFRNVW